MQTFPFSMLSSCKPLYKRLYLKVSWQRPEVTVWGNLLLSPSPQDGLCLRGLNPPGPGTHSHMEVSHTRITQQQLVCLTSTL